MKHRLLPTLFLILLIAPISASAQWTWVHPMPQGNTLRDVVFLTNTTAIAVGDYGTILVTHDTGATWSVAWNVDGVTGTLQAIDRLDDNTAVVVGDGGVMLRTSTQGFWWDVISGLGWPDLVDVSFADATHGIATGGIQGNSVALRTSGGGVNYSWDTVSLGSTVFRNVDMASATDGFAISDVGLLYHTTDGGASWSVATPPASGNTSLYVVDFLDPLHGAVATTLGEDHFFNPAPPTCFVTADGGATWSSSSLNYGLLTQDYFPGEILYPQSGTILVAGKVVCCTTSAFDSPPTGELSLSTDTGASFASAANGRPMYGLARNADGTVITVGEHGRMLRRDSGGTITTIGGPEPSQGYNQFAVGSSSFLNSQVGVAMSSDGLNYVYGEGSYLGATTDGGETWTQVSRPEDCMDVVCLSSTEMLAVGLLYNQGAVLRSTNAGASWSNIWTQSSPSALTAVAAGSATHAVAVGNGVDALVIDNGVVTVVPIGGSGFGDVAFASPSVVVALGATDMRSTDGGMTWSPTNGPFNNVTALAFTTPTRAFGVTPTGIVRSDDTGDTWTAVPSGAVTGLRGIAFADANHGMAVGRHVLMTNDGGMTWTPLDQPTDLILNHVSMIAQNLAFVSGLHENVLRYGNSPVPTLIQALDVTPRPFGAELRWRVSIDDQLAGFTIMRSSGAASERIASNIAVSERSFRDDGLTPGATYEYQLLAVDRDGSYTQSAPVKVTIPSASVELLPNQPNPFNPETTIRFMLPEKMPVVLTVHDVAGHVVATLVNGVSAAGMQTITWNADHMASGVYFAKLRAGKTEISRKMVLLK